jgi:uncharacterized protein YcfL
MRSLMLCASLLLLTGCMGSEAYVTSQHFTLVPDTSGISKDIPAGALALDTRSGQLCFTLAGSFQAAAPAIPSCESLAQKDTSNSKRK